MMQPGEANRFSMWSKAVGARAAPGNELDPLSLVTVLPLVPEEELRHPHPYRDVIVWAI